MEVKIYQDEKGKEPFSNWFNSLRGDQTRARIDNKLGRVRLNNFGDSKALGDGLYELRLHFGPGYRLYYGKTKKSLIVLLTGSDKARQAKAIKKAKQYWQDYKTQNNA